MMDMTIAGTCISWQWASSAGRAIDDQFTSAVLHYTACVAKRTNIPIPMTTRKPVQNLPKSTTAFPAFSMKSSGFAHLPHIQFGSGAIT